MVERLAHRELRNRSADVLRQVAAGATYEITNHGEVVAVLGPPPRGLDLTVRPARARGGFSALARRKAVRSVQEVLDELRDDES